MLQTAYIKGSSTQRAKLPNEEVASRKRPKRAEGILDNSIVDQNEEGLEGELKFSRDRDNWSSSQDQIDVSTSRGARNHVAQPAKLIVNRLEGDADVGSAFQEMQRTGKVVVVASTDNLPNSIRDALDAAKASRSAMKSVEANIMRGNKALAKAMSEKTSVHRAMFREGMGWVDFVWGDEGGEIRKNGVRPGERGLSHILEARKRKDGLTDRQVHGLLSRVVDAIALGKEVKRTEFQGSIRVGVEHENVYVSLVKNPGSNAWLLTGFYIRESGDNRVGKDFPASTVGVPHTPGTPTVADSLSPRTENERHALASEKTDGLGERLSMESDSSIASGGLVLKRSDDGTIQGLYDTQHWVAYIIASNVSPETAKGVFLR